MQTGSPTHDHTGLVHRVMTRRRVLGAASAALITGLSASAVPVFARSFEQVRDWPRGKPAPPLALDRLDGTPWTLAALRGQVVLLNFWASWCAPCRAEMPSLELLATRHEAAGFAVVAIDFQETLPAIRRFLDAVPFTLPIVLDRDGAAARAWTSRVFPTSVLIDRTGQPRRSVLGELDWTGDVARALVDPLVASRTV